ncbi:arabinosyltransferase domain-containing protein [Actinomycetospora sp. C-140]
MEAPRRSGGVAMLVWALVTLALGIAVPLAPVTAKDTTVTWPDPAAAPGTAHSTTLALSPPRPLSFAATVPCDALRAGGDVLRTLPAEGGGDGGLTVSAGGGATRVDISGRTVLTAPTPPGGCRLDLAVDATGLRASLDGRPLPLRCGACADVPPPQVSRLSTSADATPGAPAPSVTLHTDDRYASGPGPLKTVLLVGHLLALGGLLVTVHRRTTRPRARRRRGRLWERVRRHASGADALVAAVSLGWLVVAPVDFDDSWYPLMARDAGEAGYIGNAVYMFNVTENPFVASQYVTQLWGAIGGWGLVWQRCLPLLYGLLAWALLRAFFVLVTRRTDVRAARVPWALLLAHLVWWLPFGLTLRPEPLIVLLSVVVLLLVELARDRDVPILYVGAVMAAALAVACSPTGLVAAAPLLVEIPRAWPRTVAATRLDQVAGVAVVLAAASVAVPVAFADASLGDVLEASAVHAWYYDTVPWYDELEHYETLLGRGKTPWAQRAPVLITLATTALVAAGSARRGPDDDTLRRVLLHSAATTAVAFLLVAASPTKWVLHFPAVAAAGTVMLAVALLRGPMPRQERALATTGGVAVIVVAAAVSFAGWNVWHPFNDRGQPFGNHADNDPTPLSETLLAPHLGPVFLRNPLVWVAVALAAAGWAHWSRGRWPGRRLPRPQPERAVLTAVCLTVVGGMIGVMLLAPVRQYPGWTVALGNAKDIAQGACGLESNVTALRPTPVPFGPPTAPARTTGDYTDDTRAAAPRAVPGLGRIWHDDGPGSSGRGGLVTGWYPIPPGAGATDVLVPLLESGDPDETASVEFGRGTGVLGRKDLDDLPNVDGRTWQERPVSLLDAPAGTDAVRVVVTAGPTVGEDRLAVAEPRLVRPEPLAGLLGGAPALADQSSSSLWPCVDQVAVHDGIAPAPAFRLTADEDLTGATIQAQDWTARGGVWRHDDLNATYVSLATAVRPGGVPAKPWGRVQMMVRDLPSDRYAVTTTEHSRSGWWRGPTLAREDYADVEYQGAVG